MVASEPTPELSVVVPVKDEAENIEPLIGEIGAALDAAGRCYEIVYVDDGSADSTPDILQRLMAELPTLRAVRHQDCCGQSAAIATGVTTARAPLIATLDGDGQNDPADIPALLARYRELDGDDPLMITGRRAKRRDTWVKRTSSKVANGVRRAMLKDDTPDTGCGLKVFARADFLALPRFDHMHRFLPALILRAGGQVESVAVNHRPRERGTSKYGVWNRVWVGIVDLFGVMWLQRRPINPEIDTEADSEADQ